jgi:hypothetical protein
VRVERQVVARERDVVFEQRPQALGEHGRQPGRVEIPEQAVVDQNELGALRDRPLRQLARRRDARQNGADLVRAGHLEAVRAHVLERGRGQ